MSEALSLNGSNVAFFGSVSGILVGAALLLFGRKLFWLFVAATGFAAGLEIAPQVFRDPSPWAVLLIALVLGILGAILAFMLQKFAIAIAGFVGGGRVALGLSAAFNIRHAEYASITFVIGGILGAILLLVLFDWALILLTSVEGAHLIANAIMLPSAGCTIVVIALIVLGVLAQSSMLRRSRQTA